MSKTVTLHVPDLLQNIDQCASSSDLAWCLSRAKVQPSRPLFSQSAHLPIAALLATLKGYPKGFSYCLASPIECYADLKTVYIVNKASLSAQDEMTMVTLLNGFLQQDGIRLEIIDPGLWLFEMKHHTEVVMYDLGTVIGKSMASNLPTGVDEVYWRLLLTECQMLLSQTVSLWFWGNGIDETQHKTDFDAIYTDDMVLKAKAYNAKVNAQHLPVNWSNTMLDKAKHLLLTPRPSIAELEQQWLVPLLASLKSGVIAALTLRLDEQIEYVLTRRQFYYFWKKTKLISAFLPDGKKTIQ